MTTEEKLSAFYMNCLTYATEEAGRLTAEHKAALEELYREHVRQTRLHSAAELSVREEELRRENNKAVSETQLKIRRRLSARTQELKDELFLDVEKKLADFKQTPAYTEYLCKKIGMALRLARDPETDIRVYLDASDAPLVPEISSRCGVTIHESDEPMLGGVRAVILSRKLLFDFAFRDLLREEKEAFTFKGGLEG